MIGLSKRQAKILKRQIKRIYGRAYIPLRTSTTTITIGDVLLAKKDTSPYVDSSVFNDEVTAHVQGKGVNQNITSSNSMSISFKAAGQVDPSGIFEDVEAGLSVSFSSSNQMFLKVLNMREKTAKNFPLLRDHILAHFRDGSLKSKVYVVRGLVYADKYFLQFGAQKEGSLHFNLDASSSTGSPRVNGDFSAKWSKDVGIDIDGSNGGPLGYRVSSVRLKRHRIPENLLEKILAGMPEEDVIDSLETGERIKLLDADTFEVVDSTLELAEIELEEGEE